MSGGALGFKILSSKTAYKKLFTRRRLQIGILLLATLIILPQLDTLPQALEVVRQASVEWLVLAAGFAFLAYFYATLVYQFIAPGRLVYSRTLLVQLAGGFANRLVPSGIGALGLNTLYLAKQFKLSKTAAGVYAGINNLLGMVAFFSLSVVIFLASDISLPAETNSPLVNFILLTILLCLTVIILATTRFWPAIKGWLKDLGDDVKRTAGSFLKQPDKLLLGFFSSVCLAICNLMALWFCATAVGVSLEFWQVIVVFAGGAAAIAVSPTPNGLVAAEIAMVALLTRYGIETSLAISLVLTYRFMSYWLPILPGWLAFRHIMRRKYI